MRSKAPWNTFVPLDNTSFGVQFYADVSVALYVALENCRGSRWLKTWLEQYFRATEAFDVNSGDAVHIVVGEAAVTMRR